MGSTSANAISGDRIAPQGVPACVAARAQELLDVAVLKLLAICLGACAAVQVVALSVALLMPPYLHFIPEVG